MWLVLLLLFIVFNMSYFIRYLATCIISKIRGRYRPKQMLDEFISHDICLPSDIDFFGHMNNTRYVRDAEFARVKWYLETPAWDTILKLGGTGVTSANHIRYRKEIRLFEKFIIRTKVIYWDDKAFFMEQIHETTKDGFARAVNIVKQTLIGTTPDAVLQKVYGKSVKRPEPPEELVKLLEFSEISSKKMKKNS